MNENGSGGCLRPGDSYPDWLTFNCEGSSVTFEVPQVEGPTLKTIIIHIAYSSTADNITSDGLTDLLVKNYTKATIQLYKRESLISIKDEEGQRVVSSIEPGNKVEVIVILYMINTIRVKNDIVFSGKCNECFVRTSSPQVELADENGGIDSCCGLIKCSFRQWITDFMCRLVECCWG
jgi:hypothetical protein